MLSIKAIRSCGVSYIRVLDIDVQTLTVRPGILFLDRVGSGTPTPHRRSQAPRVTTSRR